MAKPKKSSVINPLMLIAAKNKPDQESVDKIHWPVLIALDAAKRGKATGYLANTLRDHVMTCVVLWASRGNRPLYTQATEAWNALCKAFGRPTDLLDLTTTEYQTIRKALSYYLRALPMLEIGVIAGAFIEAQKRVTQ